MGEGGDYNQLSTINDSWNDTSEVVRDKNQPSFIGAMDQGHTEGIVQLPNEHPDPQPGDQIILECYKYISPHHNQIT
jgi:hypothetical protein